MAFCLLCRLEGYDLLPPPSQVIGLYAGACAAGDPKRGPDRAAAVRLCLCAILLLGYAGGLRRSEIIGLDVVRDYHGDGAGWIRILPERVYW
ncbi:hypothetical protein [Mesorhizobium caraganae]|uniref:hypothetical protein n=1 Tax=Mesorhizobium caraganae TaxID=483206 RepID=UPI001782092A|nr:hypothetical protein [Mesorhizobium caraganae]